MLLNVLNVPDVKMISMVFLVLKDRTFKRKRRKKTFMKLKGIRVNKNLRLIQNYLTLKSTQTHSNLIHLHFNKSNKRSAKYEYYCLL